MPKLLNALSNDAADLILQGKIGVIPTDTVYGLVCAAGNPQAVKRLYLLKNRDSKPGTIIAASFDQLVDLGIKARYLKAVSQFWPGALSVIVPVSSDLAYLHLGTFGLAVRLPDDPKVSKLLQKTGPILTTSANLPGKAPANDIKEAKKYFRGLVDFYVDGGELSDRQPSTIIKIIDDEIVIVREGAVKIS